MAQKTNRRTFLQTISMAGAGLAAAPLLGGRAHGARSALSSRLNILVLMTDQQHFRAMSCMMGTEHINTPTLDSLAGDGVLFENVYCAQAVCGPSRAAIWSGLMPHQTGILGNNAGYPDDIRPHTLGWQLGNAGYETGYFGKWHVPTSSPTRSPGIGFDATHYSAGAAKDFLRRAHSSPFLCVASWNSPHEICEWSRDVLTGTPDPWASSPADCPPLPDNFEPPTPTEPQTIAELASGYDSIIMRNNYTSDDTWRRYLYAYYRLTEAVDTWMGEVLQALRDGGQEDNTVVIFTADHGDMAGAHRLNQKFVSYEESAHVPLIVRYPGMARAGQREPALVCNGIDLFPTICDYAGVALPSAIAGRTLFGTSLRGLIDTGAPIDREYVVSTSRPRTTGHEGRAVRSARYKYICYSAGTHREQLFDLSTDPGEMRDLSADVGYAGVLNEHRRMLIEWTERTGDDVWLPQYWVQPEAVGTRAPASGRTAARPPSTPSFDLRGRRIGQGETVLPARGVRVVPRRAGGRLQVGVR